MTVHVACAVTVASACIVVVVVEGTTVVFVVAAGTVNVLVSLTTSVRTEVAVTVSVCGFWTHKQSVATNDGALACRANSVGSKGVGDGELDVVVFGVLFRTGPAVTRVVPSNTVAVLVTVATWTCVENSTMTAVDVVVATTLAVDVATDSTVVVLVTAGNGKRDVH
jgi:hypothetical protein